MPNWKTHSSTRFCFATKSIVAWQPVFQNEGACNIILEMLNYSIAHRMIHIHGYVIMPTHAHFILSAPNGKMISNAMRDMCAYSSRQISEMLFVQKEFDILHAFSSAANEDRRGNSFKVWQDGYHPVTLLSEHFYREKLLYIHNNPIRKGLVEKAEDWKYSSARNYILNDHSIIAIECL